MSQMLVVGSVAFDTIHNHLGSHRRVLGGSALYASFAASPLTDVQLVGVVGRDFPDSAVAALRDHKVDIDGLEVADGETFHWEGRYADDLSSRDTLATDLNVFADFDPKIPEKFRDTPYVMLGNIDPVLQGKVLDQVRSPKLTILDTMNFWMDSKLEELNKVLGRVDVLVINEEEAVQLSGERSPMVIGKALQSKGPGTVVVKQGEYGAIVFSGDDFFCAPAFPVNAVADPTGAGDSFAGGFLASISRDDSIETDAIRRAVIYGSAIASFCVEGVGPQRLMGLERESIEARYDAFERMARIPARA